MHSLLLLFLTAIIAHAQWTRIANLDRNLTRFVASDSYLVAYGTNRISSSTNGTTWSSSVDPGFPLLHITKKPSGDFVALSYVLNPFANDPERPYNILIMESRDGVAWSEFTQIISFRGLALPTSGEIAATETFLYFTVTSEFFGFPESVSLFADGSRIIQDSLGHTNIVALDGDFFGNRPEFRQSALHCDGHNQRFRPKLWRFILEKSRRIFGA